MEPDEADSPEDEARERQHERTVHVEHILTTVREDLGNQKYPVSSEELSAYYANGPGDLPNETESIGSAFDRIDKSFEDAQEAYEAFVTEFERGQHTDIRRDAVGHEPPYWDVERADTQAATAEAEVERLDDELGYDAGKDDARRRAREAEAAASKSDPGAQSDETESNETSGTHQ